MNEQSPKVVRLEDYRRPEAAIKVVQILQTQAQIIEFPKPKPVGGDAA